ncbi:MAG TPA: hypothetical protein VHP33_13430 [Polyangiaceae bacterium]|nr:hypothetical protein [Polyangiaceae bacterium]
MIAVGIGPARENEVVVGRSLAVNQFPTLTPPPIERRRELGVHRDDARPRVAAFLLVALQRLVVILRSTEQGAKRLRIADPVAPATAADLTLPHAGEEREPEEDAPRDIDALRQERKHLAPVVRRTSSTPALESLAWQYARVARYHLVEVRLAEQGADRPEDVRDALLAQRALFLAINRLRLGAQLPH